MLFCVCEWKAQKQYFYGAEVKRLAKGLSGMINCLPTEIMGIQFLAFCSSSFPQQGEQLNSFVFTSIQVVHAHGQLSTYLALKGMQHKADLTAA